MNIDRRLAGIGALAFSVLFVVAFFVASPPGGEYEVSDVADFVAEGHRAAVIGSLFMMLVSVVGLLLATAYLSETSFERGQIARVSWGTSLLAAFAFLAGWAIVLTPATSLTIGGGPDVDPAVAYTIMQAGLGVVFAVAAMFLGVSLLALALAGRAAPMWIRWFSGLVGVLAIFSIAWFPFYAVILWGVVVGIWLLVSGKTETAAPA